MKLDDTHNWEGCVPGPPLRQKAVELFARKSLDLIISAVTPATGAILKVNNGSIPIMAVGVSDPIKSGFVKNEHDSVIDNFTARVVLSQNYNISSFVIISQKLRISIDLFDVNDINLQLDLFSELLTNDVN